MADASELYAGATDLAQRIAEKTRASVRLLKAALAAPRRALYEKAFIEEQRMHAETLRDTETRACLAEWSSLEGSPHG